MAAHSTLRRSQLIPGGRPLHAYARLLLIDSQSYSYIREQIQSVKGNCGPRAAAPARRANAAIIIASTLRQPAGSQAVVSRQTAVQMHLDGAPRPW